MSADCHARGAPDRAPMAASYDAASRATPSVDACATRARRLPLARGAEQLEGER